MAVAMMVFCRWRIHEYSVLDVPGDVKDDLAHDAERAVSLDPNNFFARLTAALAAYDLRGDFRTALAQAETALGLNSGFSEATAMTGIAKCHLGDIEDGAGMLRRAIAAAPEDPHRFRHYRDQAVVHIMADEPVPALDVGHRLVRQAPDLARNRLVLAALTGVAGDKDAARSIIAGLMAEHSNLTLRTMRPTYIGDAAMAERYAVALVEAGLPER